MTKKDKRAISNSIAALILLSGLFLHWIVFKSTNYYLLFGLILAIPFVERIIYSVLPDKKSKKRSIGKKQDKNKGLINTSPNRLRKDKEIISSRLEELSWREFERLCFLYFKAKGYKPRETGEGADGGVDLIIYNRYHKTEEAIQIKHYINSGNQITVTQIRELNSAKRNHKCVLSRFITTSRYTNDALREADLFKMTCHDLNWVKNKIVKWQEQEQEKIG
jgi:restriction system protein